MSKIPFNPIQSVTVVHQDSDPCSPLNNDFHSATTSSSFRRQTQQELEPAPYSVAKKRTSIQDILGGLLDLESGNAIIYVMLGISVLALLGVTCAHVVMAMSTEVEPGNFRAEARYLAETGLQRATDEKREGTYTEVFQVGRYSVNVTNCVSDEMDNDYDGAVDEGDEAHYYRVVSTGIIGNYHATIETVIQFDEEGHQLFYIHNTHAANASGPSGKSD